MKIRTCTEKETNSFHYPDLSMAYTPLNLEHFLQLIGSYPNQQFGQTAFYNFIKSDDSAWPNKVFNLRASEGEIEQVLNEIEDKATEGLLPDILILDPMTTSPTVLNHVKNRDYRSSTWTAMTHDLKTLDSASTAANFQVKTVQSQTDFKAWLALVETELMGNLVLNALVFEALLNNEACYFYLGMDGKEPVATSLLFVQQKGAGVYLVATKSSHRKKGFGKEVTRHCLEMAKSLGCDQVDLQATNLGKGVYESLGFVKQGIIDVFRVKKTT